MSAFKAMAMFDADIANAVCRCDNKSMTSCVYAVLRRYGFPVDEYMKYIVHGFVLSVKDVIQGRSSQSICDICFDFSSMVMSRKRGFSLFLLRFKM